MARASSPRRPAVVCLGDNMFEHAQRRRSRAGTAARSCSSRTCPSRRTSAWSPRRRRPVTDIVEKAGVVDTRYESPPSSDAVVGLYCYPSEVFGIVDDARALGPRRARDHGREQLVRQAGRDGVRRARGLVARRGRAIAGPRRGRTTSFGRTASTSGRGRRGRYPAASVRGRARLVHGADARLAAAAAGAPVEPRLLAARA